jgi:hypothetical protein
MVAVEHIPVVYPGMQFQVHLPHRDVVLVTAWMNNIPNVHQLWTHTLRLPEVQVSGAINLCPLIPIEVQPFLAQYTWFDSLGHLPVNGEAYIATGERLYLGPSQPWSVQRKLQFEYVQTTFLYAQGECTSWVNEPAGGNQERYVVPYADVGFPQSDVGVVADGFDFSRYFSECAHSRGDLSAVAWYSEFVCQRFGMPLLGVPKKLSLGTRGIKKVMKWLLTSDCYHVVQILNRQFEGRNYGFKFVADCIAATKGSLFRGPRIDDYFMWYAYVAGKYISRVTGHNGYTTLCQRRIILAHEELNTGTRMEIAVRKMMTSGDKSKLF